MGAATVLLVVARGKQCGCEEEGPRHRERHTHRERERQESEGWQAGGQRRRKGRRGAQLAAATKRESANRAMVSGRSATAAESGKLRSSERNKRDIYRGRDELRALDSTDKH